MYELRFMCVMFLIESEVMPMSKEQYVYEILQSLEILDEAQLCYIYNFIRGYFNIQLADA